MTGDRQLKRRNSGHGVFFAFCVAVVALGGFGCAFGKPGGLNPETVGIKMSEQYEPIAPRVKEFSLMALFSKMAYRKDLSSSHGCEYINDPSYTPKPIELFEQGGKSGWKRWTMPNACYDVHGLYYETYVYANDQGAIEEAVIAIRGTEGTSFWDWLANLSGMLPFVKTEYEYAKERIVPLIDSLAGSYGVQRIYLTGHSLGGGLAQEVSYLSGKISATYTFDPSPVTKWTGLRLEREIKVKDPVIYRIYESNEVLEYARDVSTAFELPRTNRKDYRLNFLRADVINAHDMSHLTCQFAARVPEEGAEHHYSRKEARSVLGKKELCPQEVLIQIPVIWWAKKQ